MAKKIRNKKQMWIYIILLVLTGIGVGIYYLIDNKVLNVGNSSNDTSNNVNNNQPPTLEFSGYVRPPVGVEFSFKNDETKKFVSTYSHFDSPGVSKTEKAWSVDKTQGEQEVSEAKNIVNVLDYFKQYFNNENIFFMGDTNIKYKNQNAAFNETYLNQQGYNFLFEDDKNYSTSLSSTFNNFANPYDKIIYKLKDFYQSKNYDDLSSALVSNVDNGFLINTYKTLPTISNPAYSGNGWINVDEKQLWQTTDNKYDENDLFYRYVKYGISDHIPVGLNIKDNANNEARIGFWNVLNLSFTDSEIQSDSSKVETPTKQKANAHTRNLADIIYNANFDLIGLVEINKNTPLKNFEYFIKYLNDKNKTKDNGKLYEGFLTINTNSSVASSGQTEQVAIIYNANLLKLNEVVYPKFYKSENNAILDNKIVKNISIYLNNNLTLNKNKNKNGL